MVGNHAYTPSTATASRPVLSARVNLLTKTEQFNDAAWGKFNTTVTANTTTAPDGTTTADSIFETTANAGHSIFQTPTVVVGVTYKTSCYIKANGRNYAFLRATLGSAIDGVSVDLVTGTASSAVGSPSNITSVNAGDGWWLVSFNSVCVGNTSSSIDIITSQDGVYANRIYVGDITKGIYLWGADLRVANDGVGIPSYQQVDTSTSYDTVGFPLYLRCDGTDDYMLTNSIDFTATDKVTVWAGVRKLLESSSQGIIELSTAISLNNGSFSLFAPDGGVTFSFVSKGSTARGANTSSAAYVAPFSGVAACSGDISGDSVILRINGTQAASNTADQGTGNYGNYPLYLFRRAGTTLPFNGRCYGMIVRGAQSSTAQIAATETYLNQKTKAF